MMSEKSQVPEGYKKTELGIIPEEWKLKKLSDLIDVHHGFPFESKYFTNVPNNFIVLVPGNFHRDGGLYFSENTKYYTGEYDSKYVLSNGDLLTVMTDLSPKMLILCRTVKLDHEKIILHNQRIGKIEILKPHELNDDYLVSLLNSDKIRDQLKNTATGTTVKHTSPQKIKSIKISLPAYKEQQKIASILSKVDEQIEQTEQIIEKTEILKKGLMQKLLTKGIGHTNFKKTELGEIPEEWKVVTIKEVTRDDKRAIKVGPFGSQLKKSEYVDSGIKVYGQENVFRKDFNYGNYYITKEKFESLSAFEIFPDDVVITMMGTIGDCMVVPKNISKGIMNSHLMRLQLKFNIIPEFLAILIKDAFYVKKQINKLSQGAIMSGLNSTIIKQISIPLPSINEQIKLVEICNKIQDLSNREINYLTQLQELKKGLMQDLLTGKVRVCI